MQQKFRLKPLSKKRAVKKRDYATACKEQDRQAIEERGYIRCESCHKTLIGVRWGHSHNLSVKHFPQFEADPENFKPRCQECHEQLDMPYFEAIVKFKDFKQLLEYRKKMDIHAYNRWVSCLLAIGVTDYQYEKDEDCHRECKN